jgi:2-dehydropantoate 2-reductase
MEIKKVSIIGLGALGILFGHFLSKRMPKEDLRIVADVARIRKYQEEKVYCNGECCEFNYVNPTEQIEPADLIIFTVKFDGLDDAIQAVRHHVNENTIILSALNGISSEEIIGDTYRMENILYCVAQGMDAVKVGNQLTYHNIGMLSFGDRKPGIVSGNSKKVAAFFESVDFPHEVVTNMLHRQWGKFMLNVGVNQTIAVNRAQYGEVQKNGTARNMMMGAMREVITLSNKEGVSLTEADLDYWLNVLAKLSPTGKPSMAQDVEANRKTEVELFSGTVLKLGKKYGVSTPLNQELYDRIQEIEGQYV